MDTELATRAEIDGNQLLIDTLRASLTDHEGRSYATAHRGLTVVDTPYGNSLDVLVSSLALVVEVEGVTLYIPCRLVVGDAPTS